ncbi:MAG: 4-hydroxy-tetrahydrodipicolinate reductase [Leptospiraceae bacterium]|nr:4-hydroxy-tetrahydrodipicolinate reductase [Leptospiraceae bacterium]
MSKEQKIKVGLIGAGGRMGKAITQVLAHSHDSVLSGAVERADSILLGMDSGVNSSLKENHILYTSDMEVVIKNSDVLIDFSSHTSTIETLELCSKHSKPIVIGSTGHSEKEIHNIESYSKTLPIVFSPNMSVGVNLMFKLIEIAGKVLEEHFDVEILDIHHRHKKDAPSGTAMALKKTLLKAMGRNESDVIYGRHGNHYQERDQKQIAVHTMRAGEVVGEHTVYFFSPEERIEIKHTANDRKTFAVGAVKAAEYIVKQKHGLYDMFDVLGI